MKRIPLTAERLREVLDFDQTSGCFKERTCRNPRVAIGGSPGTARPDGYWEITIDCVTYLAHRLAWLHVHGEWPKNQIDHINRIRTDNRIANLRDVTPSMNQHNRNSPQRNNTSGALGVRIARNGTFCAEISAGRKRYYVGQFHTLEEAAYAYQEAKRRLHPSMPRAA